MIYSLMRINMLLALLDEACGIRNIRPGFGRRRLAGSSPSTKATGSKAGVGKGLTDYGGANPHAFHPTHARGVETARINNSKPLVNQEIKKLKLRTIRDVKQADGRNPNLKCGADGCRRAPLYKTGFYGQPLCGVHALPKVSAVLDAVWDLRQSGNTLAHLEMGLEGTVLVKKRGTSSWTEYTDANVAGIREWLQAATLNNVEGLEKPTAMQRTHMYRLANWNLLKQCKTTGNSFYYFGELGECSLRIAHLNSNHKTPHWGLGWRVMWNDKTFADKSAFYTAVAADRPRLAEWANQQLSSLES